MSGKEWTRIGVESAARWLGSGLIPDGATIVAARGRFTEEDEAKVIVLDLSNGQRLTWRPGKRRSSLTFSAIPPEAKP